MDKEFPQNPHISKQIINMHNTNILYAIKQKMSTDIKLSELVTIFKDADSDILRLDLTEKILFRLTGADKTDCCMNAKKLAAMQTLDKLSLISFSLNFNSEKYKNHDGENMIDKEFESLKLDIYAKLMREIYIKGNFLNIETVIK